MTNFKRKNLRLKNFDYINGFAYFITICTFEKRPYFFNLDLAKFVESTIEYRIKNDGITVFCYCIMPNHIHILLSLNENYEGDLSRWVSSFKRYISYKGKKIYKFDKLWQKNYNDHVVRNDESLNSIAEYILNNPVRKNMVAEWKQYPFCKISV